MRASIDSPHPFDERQKIAGRRRDHNTAPGEKRNCDDVDVDADATKIWRRWPLQASREMGRGVQVAARTLLSLLVPSAASAQVSPSLGAAVAVEQATIEVQPERYLRMFQRALLPARTGRSSTRARSRPSSNMRRCALKGSSRPGEPAASTSR
jgi:hypothetical protein